MKKDTESATVRKIAIDAVDIIEKEALNKPADWASIKEETLLMINNSSSTPEIYQSLAWCLASLGDSHSFLLDPAKNRVFSAKKATPKVVFHAGKSRHARDQIEGMLITKAEKKFGYIYVPTYDTHRHALDESEFARVIQLKLKKLIESGVTGWIVDLRGNAGGNMWPMISGIGPLTSAEKIGGWLNATESADWMYKNGEAFQKAGVRQKLNAKCAAQLEPIPESIPIAVLIDRYTASSGEATAICFCGRKKTRFFGESTWGVATANAEYKLENGALMYLTIAYDVDRNGKLYKNGIEPDFLVSDQPDVDVVLESAEKWLLAVTEK